MTTLAIQRDIPLSLHTSFALGGVARFFVVAKSIDEMREVFRFAREKELSVFVLGGGSNVLVNDAGYDGVILKMGIEGIEEKADGEDVYLEVGAGEEWDALVSYTTERGWWGFENLSAIPGKVGAAPVQNIGAYGVEVGESIVWVEVYDPHTDTLTKISQSDCAFGYRQSAFQSIYKQYVITKVCYRVSAGGTPNISYKDFKDTALSETSTPSEIRERVISIRARKFPSLLEYGTAGSFFINPTLSEKVFEKLKETYPDIPGFKTEGGVKVPLAFVLDTILSLRGYKKESASVYEKHALVLVSERFQKAECVVSLAREIAERVLKETGIEISPEVTLLTPTYPIKNFLR